MAETNELVKRISKFLSMYTGDFEFNNRAEVRFLKDARNHIKQQQSELDKESIEHLQIQQEAERAFTKQIEQLEKTIESFGNNPAGFDWGVLDKIDALEIKVGQLKGCVRELIATAKCFVEIGGIVNETVPAHRELLAKAKELIK